jgi:formyl-CoA transferase
MTKALEGVRVLDMTHVQSGPTATQILAWFGADVIKVEMPGKGDATRSQLRDLEDVDSLYFTMLNSNKRSITLNNKSEKGQEVFAELVRRCDVLVENFAPGALDRQGFPWERLQELNPRLIYASIKGFFGGPYADCKAYENVAQSMGGSVSTTGWEEGPPAVTGAQIGDSGTGVHLVAGVLAALYQRTQTGRGQRVQVSMRDAVLNLCRVKMRDQQRLQHGPLREYPNKEFGDTVPRSANASGGGQPGEALKCAPGGPNDYIYTIIQPQGWAPLMKLVGREDLIEDADFATPEARLSHLDECFAIIEEWTKTQNKFDVMRAFNAINVPCGPIMSMKDIYEDESLYEAGMLARVKHPERGEYVNVGCPIQLSDSPVEVERSPLLGEHNEEVLEWLGLDASEFE